MKIFKCKKCGKIIIVAKDITSNTTCCGEEMVELIANTVDAAVEKHVPVVDIEESSIVVTCGEVIHPMEEKHYIEFMIMETSNGFSVNYLKPGDDPISKFHLEDGEELKTVYAYCNLHGLWSNNIK